MQRFFFGGLRTADRRKKKAGYGGLGQSTRGIKRVEGNVLMIGICAWHLGGYEGGV